MPPVPSFPPELHDYIIDFLSDDKSALLSCSLVSRGWKAASQYHLFHTIKVRHPTTLSSLNNFLQNSPHIAILIRDLSLSGSGCTTFDEQMHITTHDISKCASHLSELKYLRLEGIWWSDVSREAADSTSAERRAHSSTGPNLCRLIISKIFTTPDGLLDAMCAFGSIETLNVERVYWTWGVDRGDPASRPQKRRPSLRGLQVGPGSTYNMLRCFLPLVEERMDVSALDSLSLEFEHFDAWQELREFLQHVSPHLKRLSLKFGKYAIINECTFVRPICRVKSDFVGFH